MKKALWFLALSFVHITIYAQDSLQLSPYTDRDKIIAFYREYWLGLGISILAFVLLLLFRRKDRKSTNRKSR